MGFSLLNAKTLPERLRDAFLVDDRWLLYFKGLGNTLTMSLFAVLIGVFLGIILAAVIFTAKKTGKGKIAAAVCNLYVTVIRGTPVVLQLFIMYFIVLTFVKNDILVGSVTFGLNSAAYVAEVARAGLESVDEGQMEAGRSLGLSYSKTMLKIVLPQALRNMIPALFNEFIALVKETSVAGYVGILDLGKVPGLIQSRSFDYLFPLLFASLLYLVVVYFLTLVEKLIEKALSKGDRNAGVKKITGGRKKWKKASL